MRQHIGTDIHPDGIHNTEILEVDLFIFAYRLFHEDFYPIYQTMEYTTHIFQ